MGMIQVYIFPELPLLSDGDGRALSTHIRYSRVGTGDLWDHENMRFLGRMVEGNHLGPFLPT